MKSKIKYVSILCFLLSVYGYNPLVGQINGPSSVEQNAQKFNAITINSQLKLVDLFASSLTINSITSKIGSASNIETISGFERNTKILHYPNNDEITLFEEASGFVFLEILSKSSRLTFNYNGINFKVGNNISVIADVFPAEYNARNSNQVFVDHPYADVYLKISYGSNQIINEIKIVHLYN